LAALPALLWVVAGLGVGLIIVFGQLDTSTLPKFVLPVLAPVLPGFGLAASAAAVLSIPLDLWRLDVGLYLLLVLLPLLVLTGVFYVSACLFGRGVRRLFRRRYRGVPKEPRASPCSLPHPCRLEGRRYGPTRFARWYYEGTWKRARSL
jgi:hypothetical protein